MPLRRRDTLSPCGWRLTGLFIVVCLGFPSAGFAKPPADIDEQVPDSPLGLGPPPQQQALEVGEDEDEHEFPPQEQEQYPDDKSGAAVTVARAVGGEEGSRSDEDSSEAEEQGARVAPKYMLDLYRKFSHDKYSHPIANIVRSFLNINAGVAPVWSNGNNTRIALHTLLFNISSINHDEEIYLAELRLFAARKTQRIFVYEVVHPPLPGNAADHRRYHLLSSREIPKGHGEWETFSITEVVRRWVKTQATAGHILEVRVDTARPLESADEKPEVDDMGIGSESQPILVVFSNDRKRRKIELRELHEIEAHENQIRDDATGTGSDYMPPSPPSVAPEPPEEEAELDEEYEYEADGAGTGFQADEERSNSTAFEGKRAAERSYSRLLGALSSSSDRGDSPERGQKLSRVKRNSNKNRRRRAKRNSCRRKPMYISFRDVQWENWIIEPAGYQAYECTGQCYFPLAPHLTPTKYAMVKSLLHATYPKKASAVCCVPTRLEPISLLYVDEHGIVTYKYKYDGMVVAECGCR